MIERINHKYFYKHIIRSYEMTTVITTTATTATAIVDEFINTYESIVIVRNTNNYKAVESTKTSTRLQAHIFEVSNKAIIEIENNVLVNHVTNNYTNAVICNIDEHQLVQKIGELRYEEEKAIESKLYYDNHEIEMKHYKREIA